MSHYFTAFIDEAGDEGFKIVKRPQRLSSEWFIMSAVICTNGIEKMMERRLAPIGAIKKKLRPFHFRDMGHHERIAAIDALQLVPFKVISVLAHKPTVQEDSALRNEKHVLFKYTTKLLIERISWYCDEHAPEYRDGEVKMIFSERGQLTEGRLRNQIANLQNHKTGNSVRWNVINAETTEVLPNGSRVGLQVADFAASSVEQAIERSQYDTTEHRYLKLWRYHYYRRDKRCMSYGIKFFPSRPDEEPSESDRMAWLKHF